MDVRQDLERASDGGRNLVGLKGLAVGANRVATARNAAWWDQTITRIEQSRQWRLSHCRLDRGELPAVLGQMDLHPDFDFRTVALTADTVPPHSPSWSGNLHAMAHAANHRSP